jgi:hypothetical protein
LSARCNRASEPPPTSAGASRTQSRIRARLSHPTITSAPVSMSAATPSTALPSWPATTQTVLAAAGTPATATSTPATSPTPATADTTRSTSLRAERTS